MAPAAAFLVLLLLAPVLSIGAPLPPTQPFLPHEAPRGATAGAPSGSPPALSPSRSLSTGEQRYQELAHQAESAPGESVTTPLTTTWTNLTVPNLPPPLAAATMVYDPARGATILFGGITSHDVPTNQTWSYQSQNGRWANLSGGSQPPARSGAAMAYDNGSGDLLLFGGYPAEADVALGDCWLLPAQGGWTPCPASSSSPSPRGDPAMVGDPSLGGVVLYGGQAANGTDLSDTWLWTFTGGWLELDPTGTAPRALWGMEAVALPGNAGAFFYGGVYTRIGGESFYYQSYVLTPALVWTPGPALATPPSGMWAGSGLAAMAYLPSLQGIVLFGGAYSYSIEGLTYASDQTWFLPYNGAFGAWRQLAIANVTGVFDAGYAYDPAIGAMLLFGGVQTVHVSSSSVLPLVPQFVEFGASENWTPALNDSAPPPLALTSIAYDSSNGDVLLFGGAWEVNTATASVLETNETWVLAPSGTWTEEFPRVSPSARAAATLEYLPPPMDEFLLFGGFSLAGSLNDSWTYQIGGSWENVTHGVAPSPRASLALATVPGEDRFYLFGGLESCAPGLPGFVASKFLNDTWEYSSGTWTNVTRSVAPGARAGSFLIGSSVPGDYVLAGGTGPSGGGCTTSGVTTLHDEWLFNSTDDQWSPQREVLNASSPIFGCAAYDPQEGVGVYSFGINGVFLLSAGYSNEVWLAGSNLTFEEASPGPDRAPIPQATGTCVYDTDRQGVLLYGGIGATGAGLYTILGATWLLKEVAWNVSLSTDHAVSGTPFYVNATALTAGGAVADRNATLSLFDSTGTVSPSTLAVVDGHASSLVAISTPDPGDSLEVCGLGLCVNLTLLVQAVPSVLTLSPIGPVVVAGTPFTLTVSVVSSSGTPVLGWDGEALLSVPGSALTPGMVAITNGTGRASVELLGSGTDLTLWASAAGLSAESAPFDVDPGALASLNGTALPHEVETGSWVEVVLKGLDAEGNGVSGIVVKVSDSFHDLEPQNVTLENGSASALFSVGDLSGRDVLFLQAPTLSATTNLTIVAAPSVKAPPSPAAGVPTADVAAIVGALIAGLVLLFVLAFLGLLPRRAPKKKEKAPSTSEAEGSKEKQLASSFMAFLPAEEKEEEEAEEGDDR